MSTPMQSCGGNCWGGSSPPGRCSTIFPSTEFGKRKAKLKVQHAEVCYALSPDEPSGSCWVVSSDAGERSFPSLDAFLESVKHRARVGLRFRRLERSARYVVDDAG